MPGAAQAHEAAPEMAESEDMDAALAEIEAMDEDLPDEDEAYALMRKTAMAQGRKMADVAEAINGYGGNSSVWQNVGGVKFHSGQTPLIFDPVSTVAFGYASCTGVSTTYIAALRVAGVPARLVGTPAWLGDPAKGNHNWVEVFEPASGAWGFIEGKPAGGGETLADPCDKWFCSPAKAAGTQFFAAQWSRATNASIYPMAWDVANLDVPGVDRTAYYQQACGAC